MLTIRPHHFDTKRGWTETCPGWHEVVLEQSDGSFKSIELYDNKFSDILYWLYNNIDNCERHARWLRTDLRIYLKFRYERDYILFKLMF